jgi:hypothetical protein
MRVIGCSMRDKNFLRACQLIKKNLVNLDMNRAFNSVGSNVFFEFGEEKEIIHKNGRRNLRKEWSIWLSKVSWRLTKNEEYIIGSGDPPEEIQVNIQKLLGKRFRSFQFLSQFLDIEFNFEDGYQLTTFFNWIEEDQWTLFLPDNTNIGVDCANAEEIKNIRKTAKHFQINENYKKIELPYKDIGVTGIDYNKYGLPVIYLEHDTWISLENCTWRLERDNDYLIGCLDDDYSKTNENLLSLIENKLNQIDVINSMMDARFQFENQYVLKTFTCCRAPAQWKVCLKDVPVFYANIQILDKQDEN